MTETYIFDSENIRLVLPKHAQLLAYRKEFLVSLTTIPNPFRINYPGSGLSQTYPAGDLVGYYPYKSGGSPFHVAAADKDKFLKFPDSLSQEQFELLHTALEAMDKFVSSLAKKPTV